MYIFFFIVKRMDGTRANCESTVDLIVMYTALITYMECHSTCVRSDVGQESHGVAALTDFATVFAHVALVLLSLSVDLLSVFQHILVDLSQKIFMFLFDVNEQLLLILKSLRAFNAFETSAPLWKLLHTVLLIAEVSSAGHVLVKVTVCVE